jgi:hypothetical protein
MSDSKRPFSGGWAWAMGGLLLAAGPLTGGFYLWTQRQKPPAPIVMAPAVTSSSGYFEEDEINKILGELQNTDPREQVAGVEMVREAASSRPMLLSDGLPKWLGYLLELKDYQDVETFTAAAIDEKPQGMPAVSDEQRARVIALMAEGKFKEALPEAKSYFNVATLHESADAADLLREVCKRSGTAGPADAIVVDDAPYEQAIARLRDKKDSYGSLVGLGNLFLLADRPVEAQECFERGCVVSAANENHLQVSLEGVARAMRAEDGNVDRANAFLTAIQHGDCSKLPKDLATIDADELVRVSQLIVLADKPVGDVPALELARQKDDGGPPVTIETGFECSTPLTVTTLSATHLLVRLTTPVYRDWFMFRVRGAAGRAVRIDIKNDSGTLDKWWSLNPVYLDSAQAGSSLPTAAAKGWNGATLPDTSGQDWHFIANAWMQDSATFSFVQKFPGDEATVAMRVPYTPTDNEAYFKALAANSLAKIVQVGQSRQGRPLLLLQIGQPEAGKPCVLIYAGEHADEHDAMWVARGAADYLLSADPSAAALRQKFTWLIIPMLDPDSSFVSRHEGIIISFLMALKTPESIAYANWFAAWANAGHRLDVVFDLHNRQSHEGTDVEAALMERDGVRGTASLALHQTLMNDVAAGGFTFARRPLQWGWSPDRLGGWLSRRFGPITLAYELNSQDPTKHLNLQQLAELGKIFADSAAKFLPSPQGSAALADIDQRRALRDWQMARYAPDQKNEDAIVSETKRTRIQPPPDNPIVAADENWVP